MKTIVAASNNKHKIREIKEILKDTGYDVISLKDAGIDIDPEENSETFEGNALIKAKAAAQFTDSIVIADDSGLWVDCLGGLPGVRSKRYAGPSATDSDNNEFLVNQLSKHSDEEYEARFICVIALVNHDKDMLFKGTCEGNIILNPQGENGFGYDPHFFVPKFNRTMAQLTDSEKNAISHRGNALKKLKQYLKGCE